MCFYCIETCQDLRAEATARGGAVRGDQGAGVIITTAIIIHTDRGQD